VKRSFLLVAAAVAVGLAAWWLVRVERPVTEPPREPVSARLEQTRVIVRHQGTRQVEIEAGRVDVSAGRGAATFTGRPRVVLYAGDRPVLTATGERITYDRATQAVRAEGGLRLTTPDGALLVARAATWDAQLQVLELAGDVEVTFPFREGPR
jgi:lipopolysaccharide assembly outer membrane protein LptD (OstA)